MYWNYWYLFDIYHFIFCFHVHNVKFLQCKILTWIVIEKCESKNSLNWDYNVSILSLLKIIDAVGGVPSIHFKIFQQESEIMIVSSFLLYGYRVTICWLPFMLACYHTDNFSVNYIKALNFKIYFHFFRIVVNLSVYVPSHLIKV